MLAIKMYYYIALFLALCATAYYIAHDQVTMRSPQYRSINAILDETTHPDCCP